MKPFKSVLAAIFTYIYDRQVQLPQAHDFGTADRAEEKERDRRFIASLKR